MCRQFLGFAFELHCIALNCICIWNYDFSTSADADKMWKWNVWLGWFGKKITARDKIRGRHTNVGHYPQIWCVGLPETRNWLNLPLPQKSRVEKFWDENQGRRGFAALQCSPADLDMFIVYWRETHISHCLFTMHSCHRQITDRTITIYGPWHLCKGEQKYNLNHLNHWEML